MKRRKKNSAFLLFLGMILTLLAGCGSSHTNNETVTPVLKFGCSNYSGELNPGSMIDAAYDNSRYGIGECLFRFADDMTVENALCDSYEVSDDHKIWTFHIRDGVKFSDGKEMTPQTIVDCWEMLYGNEEGDSNPTKYMDYDTMTADETARTLTVVLKESAVDLRRSLAYPVFVILNVNVDALDLSKNPIGTGPYVIADYKPERSMILSKNKYYWKGAVPYDKVEITFLDASSSKKMALLNGDENLVVNITEATDLDALEADNNFNVHIGQSIRTGFSYINYGGILGDDILRKAMMTALDEETMCQVTVGGLYTEGYSVLPSALAYGYEELKDPYANDIDGAGKMLDDAGYVDTDGDGIRERKGKKISLKYLTYDSRHLTEFTQAIKEQLSSIGIEVEIQIIDADTEWNMLVAGEYDLCAANWTTAETGDPTEFFANWYSKSDANYCNYKNEEYDTLYKQLGSTFEGKERAALIRQMQQILIDDAAVVVHGYYNHSMISDKTVEGATVHTADYYWLTTEIKPAQ